MRVGAAPPRHNPARARPPPQVITLSWAALSLALFGLLAWAVTRDRSPLDRLDELGRRAEDWADDHETLQHVLRLVEIGFNTIPVTGRDDRDRRAPAGARPSTGRGRTPRW